MKKCLTLARVSAKEYEVLHVSSCSESQNHFFQLDPALYLRLRKKTKRAQNRERAPGTAHFDIGEALISTKTLLKPGKEECSLQ